MPNYGIGLGIGLGLRAGRAPRTSPGYLAGVFRTIYNNYFNGDIAFFSTATVNSSGVATNFTVSDNNIVSYQFLGYFLPDYTGDWIFSGNSDDYYRVWVGSNALTPTNLNNNTSTAIGSYSFTVSLVAGTYYPIRVAWGNLTGPGALTMSYSHTGISSTSDYTGKLFYNPATNGY
ncbi:hypothetical protein EBZ39_00920 [bacterium]|nr:hypothetical protein [bacterium]